MDHDRRRWLRRSIRALALTLLLAPGRPAGAQVPPAGEGPEPVKPKASTTQTLRPWTVIVEMGVSDVHGRTEADGFGGALRLARRLFGYDWMRAEVAFAGGQADRNFGTAELGLEFRLCARCRITGFLGLGGGFLQEEHWNGGMLRANVGAEARLSERFSVRVAAQAGTHDGVRGPHLATLGVAWRFGRSKTAP